MRLLEGTRNDLLDTVKRNMTNLFEDVDDPFAEDLLDSLNHNQIAPAPYNQIGGSKDIFGQSKVSKFPTPSTGGNRGADKRNDFDIMVGGVGRGGGYLFNEGDFSHSVTPTHGEGNNHHQQAIAIKQSVTSKLANQRGFQFRIKDK